MNGAGRCKPFRGRGTVVAIGMLWAQAAAQPVIPADAIDLGWGGRLSVNGMRMDVRLFQAAQTPAELAARLARQPGLEPWLLPLPDGLMLTGARGRRPWLMQLRQRQSGATQGMLAIGLGEGARVPPAPAVWLPQGAALLLDLRTNGAAGPVAQQVYAYGGSAGELSRLLQARLHAQGWRRQAGGQADEGLMEWQRARRVLRLVVVKRPQGSGLLAVEHAVHE